MDQDLYLTYDGDSYHIGRVGVLFDGFEAEDASAARRTITNAITDIVGEMIFGDGGDEACITISIQ